MKLKRFSNNRFWPVRTNILINTAIVRSQIYLQNSTICSRSAFCFSRSRLSAKRNYSQLIYLGASFRQSRNHPTLFCQALTNKIQPIYLDILRDYQSLVTETTSTGGIFNKIAINWDRKIQPVVLPFGAAETPHPSQEEIEFSMELKGWESWGNLNINLHDRGGRNATIYPGISKFTLPNKLPTYNEIKNYANFRESRTLLA